MSDPKKLCQTDHFASHSDARELEPTASSPRRPESRPRTARALLDLALELPLEAGPEHVAQAFVKRLAELLGDCNVGLHLREPRDGSHCAICYHWDGRTQRQNDPASPLFNEDEWVILLDAGSALHISPTHAMLFDSRDAVELVERAADVLNLSLLRARTLSDARGSFDEVRRLQERLIHSEKLASLGRIVAGLVHELTNPVTSILAYTEFLRRRAIQRSDADANAPDDVERLERIAEAAERVLSFSREIVAYSRPSNGLPEPTHINQIVEKALLFCDHELSALGVSVELDVEEQLPAVRGVFGQLTQVLVNVITDAIHAMPDAGGKLSIRAHRSSQGVRVEVADNGSGMDAATLQRVFEPFFTTKREGAGAGLGLSIVHDIVTAHRGTLDARSTPNEGTVFRIELPLA